MTDTALTPGRLWKRMPPEQRYRAALAFWQDETAAADQVQAVLLISQQKKFRPKTVAGLDGERKARHLASVPTLPDTIAARVLVLYHLAEQRPMMGAFLDALGIAHENGLIREDNVRPDKAKVGPAATAIANEYPVADVSIYLALGEEKGRVMRLVRSPAAEPSSSAWPWVSPFGQRARCPAAPGGLPVAPNCRERALCYLSTEGRTND